MYHALRTDSTGVYRGAVYLTPVPSPLAERGVESSEAIDYTAILVRGAIVLAIAR